MTRNSVEYHEIRLYLARILRDWAAAEDLVQEVYLKWTKADEAEIQNPRAWRYRTARNLALDYLRRQKKFHEIQDYLMYRTTDDARQDATPADVMEKKEETEMLLLQLHALPPRQREAVRLKFQQKLTYDEIAAVMGESRSTVGWLLHEAIRTLRDALKKNSE
ncbi:MAG: sigma-70 family RNA polymerase sigma factor [Planctomycetia bacterium]|nr:sigma-70 family RNA polymerase sigma factor [Planctomycetia bacterium]